MEKQKQKAKKSYKTITLGSNRYKVMYPLGKGSQGKVYCVEREGTGEYFAMKVCNPTQETANQIAAHKNFNCQNIVSIIEANKVDDKIYIILELGECNLEKYIDGKVNKRLDQEELFRLIRDVSNGLAVIHQNGFIHHDIKSSNIILNFDLFKIADFGVTMKEMKTFRGTPFYLAPQSMEMKTYFGSCDSAIDIWALGVVVFESCFDMHPIYTKSSTDLEYFKKQIEQMVKEGYSFQKFKNSLKKDENPRKLKKFEDIQKQLKNKQLLEYFLNRVFTYEPTRRLKLQQIPGILNQLGFLGQRQSHSLHHQPAPHIPHYASQPVLPTYDQSVFLSQQQPMRRLPSYGSNQTIDSQTFIKNTIQMPVSGTMTQQPNGFKSSVIQFLSNTIQIINMTMASCPNQAVAFMSIISQIILNYQSGLSYKIPKQNLLNLYQRLYTLYKVIPGLFYRIIIIAYLDQILREYSTFILKMYFISSGEIRSGDFKEIENYGSKIDYNKLNQTVTYLQQVYK